jgi:hypothetical protein
MSVLSVLMIVMVLLWSRFIFKILMIMVVFLVMMTEILFLSTATNHDQLLADTELC